MHEIRIYGVGYGGLAQLGQGLYAEICNEPHLYVRTLDHPVFAEWEYPGRITSFDSIYEQETTFEQVYLQMAEVLIAAAQQQDVAYVVPGHPMVAEKTVQLLLEPEQGKGSRYQVRIRGGQSFLDQVYTSFQFDPVDGCALLDGTSLQEEQFTPYLHLVIMQVYDRFVASDVKLTLMQYYPDEYPVVVGTALGIAGLERMVKVPLYQLDHLDLFNNLTCIYVPKAERMEERLRHFQQLNQIIAHLRSPDGCPWDRKQTHRSLRPYVLEEAYEVVDAIDEGDVEHLQEELGDLLLQVMLHGQIGREAGEFSIYDIFETLNRKMIHRHPHVFGTSEVEDAQDVVKNWQQLKAEERQGTEQEHSQRFAGIPVALPALQRALAIQKEAANLGFDWSEPEEVWQKVLEELREVEQASLESDAHLQEELGDLLFALLNYSRFVKIDLEAALAEANRKFMRRFQYMEQALQREGSSLEASSLAKMEQYWQEAKRQEQEKD